jgi:hypothetical protein
MFGWGSEDTDAVGNAAPKITSGLRHLFTGEVAPEILLELNRIDSDHVTKRWVADSKMSWWQSSRSIVLLWLNVNVIGLLWADGATGFTMNEVVMTSLLGTLAIVNTAFFGSKGVEYIKAGKAP